VEGQDGYILVQNSITYTCLAQFTLFDGEPLNEQYTAYTRCTSAKPIGKLGLTLGERADVITMIDIRVTNLNGKLLTKLIHWFIVTLTKML